jgi:hypothetical protein
MEMGLYNLTNDEVPALIHFSMLIAASRGHYFDSRIQRSRLGSSG